MRRLKAICLLGSLLCCRLAHASLFGEENINLTALVAQGVEQAKRVRETLGYLRETTEYARDTAAFAQASVQVGRNVSTLLSDPAAFLAYSTRSWHESFPELRDILEHAYDIRAAKDAISRPQDMALYDPYAYVNAFDRLNAMEGSGFEVIAHALDRWGVNDPSDEAIKNLQVSYDASQRNLEKLADAINATGISPVEAALYTAHATSSSAGAQVQAAATLQHISRNMELLIMDQTEQAARDQAQQDLQASHFADMHLKSWRLDPVKSGRLSKKR